MRGPSPDLLRALRLATQRRTTVPNCLAARHAPRHPSRQSSRSLRTSSRLLAAAWQSPSQGGLTPLTNSPSHLRSTSSSQYHPQYQHDHQHRSQSTASPKPNPNPRAPRTHDRGPASEEETQTDFSKMDILANAGAATPATAIDACAADGFYLNNGVHTTGGMGVLLLDGEAFVWTPWDTTATGSTTGTTSETAPSKGRSFHALLTRGVLTIPPSSLGLLALVYPKPDLLIIGTGRTLWMLSPATRRYLSEELGMRVDVMDTANAAAAYNLLATERGVTEVGALMIPDGFRGV